MPEQPHTPHQEDAPQNNWAVLDPSLRTVEAPDFNSNVMRLESMAGQGLVTPEGVRSFEFRAGIEVEFQLADPQKLNDFMAQPTMTAGKRDELLDSVLNKSDIAANVVDMTDTPEEERLRAEVHDVINALVPRNEKEAKRKQDWLDQVPQFTTKEFINFRLYQEFSTASLADPKLNANATLAEVDEFSNSQGWLEFRFGTGELQTGYYDNPGVSEIRLVPCAPHEATQRKAVVLDRLAEIAGEYGVLAMKSPHAEHVNLSIYEKQADEARPVLGNNSSDARRTTVDVTSGIAAAYQDGLWVNSDDAQYEHTFSRHHTSELNIGPTRRSLRVLEGRLELRTSFRQVDQALDWLLAGSIAGLAKGAEGLAAEGYVPTNEETIYHVQRTPDFDKQTDVHIQRAFEASEQTELGFNLDAGWNMVRCEELFTALTGKTEYERGVDVFNDVVFGAIQLTADGTPYIDQALLTRAIEGVHEFSRPAFDEQPALDEAMIEHLNGRIATVRLQPTTIVKGVGRYHTDGREESLAKLQASPLARLAYGDDVNSLVEWLETTPIRSDMLERED